MTPTLLLVEDNPKTRELLLAILATSGYEIAVAEDGLGALNLARKYRFDVVLTDHKMPLMDGLTLIRNLRELESYVDAPLLLMTTDDTVQVGERAERMGADRVFAKPMDAALLRHELLEFSQRDVA
ncbi:MAG: response regulator [Idiomarina sp.]|nr:response regulator [Idiomarina sp.]